MIYLRYTTPALLRVLVVATMRLLPLLAAASLFPAAASKKRLMLWTTESSEENLGQIMPCPEIGRATLSTTLRIGQPGLRKRYQTMVLTTNRILGGGPSPRRASGPRRPPISGQTGFPGHV